MIIENLVKRYEGVVDDGKKKNVVITLWVLLLAATLYIPLMMNQSFSVVVVFGTLMVFLMLITLCQGKKISLKGISKPFLFLEMVIGVSFLLHGIYFSVLGYIAIGMTFSVVIPAINIVFEKCYKDKFSYAIAKGTVIAYIIYFVFCFFLGPKIDDEPYAALLGNPNLLGNFVCVVAASVIFLWGKSNKTDLKSNILYAFLLTNVIALGYFSNSRTNMIALLFMLFYTLFMFLLTCRSKFNIGHLKTYAKHCLAIMLCCCVTFTGTFFALTTAKEKVDGVLNNIVIELVGQKSGNGAEANDVTLEESMGLAGSRFSKGISTNDSDAFTSGRIGIWSAYINEIGFIGHAEESMDLNLGERIYKDTNAHNFFLQVAYSAGAIAGIALLLYVLCTAFIMLKKSFIQIVRNEIDYSTIFFGCIAIAFAMNSITSGGYMLYTYFVPTFFWLMANNICFKE